MRVSEAIKSRRSVRKYQDQDVPEEIITELLESARLAPSGHNTQPWHFIVVRDQERKRAFQKANHDQPWISTVPVLIVCVADLASRLKHTEGITIDEQSPEVELKKSIRDTAIAIDHLVLAATELGLATCWHAWFEQKDVRHLFDIPPDKYVVAVITVGYGDEEPDPRPRKDLSEIVSAERWVLR